MERGAGDPGGRTASAIRMEDIHSLRLATVTFPDDHPLAGRKGVVRAFAIRHPLGVVLVDTGLGGPHPLLDARYRPDRWDLIGALEGLRLGRSDVVAIINTHLHFDHCGRNGLFPNTPIYVQRAEYEAAASPGYTIRECVDFPGATYRFLDGDAEPIPGIRILATPGHTPGHQSVAVATDDGLVLLPGHAIYSAAEYDGREAPQEISEASIASAGRLRALRPRRVFFSHDDEAWASDS